MTRSFSVIGSGLDAIAAVFKAVIAILLAVMLAINTANIISRSFFGAAFEWVFHWTMLMFVWMTCLGLYVYIRENRDVVVDIIAARVPLALRRVLAVFADLIGLLFMYMVLSPALELTALQTGNMETIALPIYVTSLPLYVSALCLIAHFMLHAALVITGRIEPFPRTSTQSLTEPGAAK